MSAANPEILVGAQRDGQICNLRFFTHRSPAWRNTFYRYYEGRVTERIIQDALQLCVVDSENPQKKHLTVNIYNSGVIMLQGARPVLINFKNETFDVLKGMVEQIVN